VQVTFDPAVLTFRDLLEFFFAFHDPTTMNRQGHDEGTQYRSAIFYHSPEQHATARAMIVALTDAGTFAAPIVTEVTPFKVFYKAEEHHQGYYRGNSEQPYCRATITPKVTKLREKYLARLKSSGARTT
jgi:peptide-methionine (S)-S-oxide reductase